MKMRPGLKTWATSGAVASIALALASLPAVAQDGPQSILPGANPGNQPAQPPAQPPQAQPQPQPQRPPTQGVRIPGNGDVPEVELSIPAGSNAGQTPPRTPAVPVEPEPVEEDDVDADLADLPELTATPADARSLSSVGLIGTEEGGFAPDSFGDASGTYVHSIMASMNPPLVSRWATIMGRRLLSSHLDTPEGMSGQQFAADRAWLLLKMGEANTARALVQQVDVSRATKPLYGVALQVYLAAVDPAGACPLVNGGVDTTGRNDWKMMRSLCASFAGEQSRADALFASARNQGTATGIDLLLAEKLLGASSQRRAVTIKWDGVDALNSWRHGMALSTGVKPPQNLYDDSGRQVTAWLALAPTLTAADRAEAAIHAAALGTLSSSALVSLYAEIGDNEVAPDTVLGRAAALHSAYAAANRSGRLQGLEQLLPGGEEQIDAEAYGELVLASRAAAAIAPDADLSEDLKGWLIASMLTSGLDRQAATWSAAVEPGSFGWALIQASSPRVTRVDDGALSDFIDDWGSDAPQKANLLVAGLAGLGRIDGAALGEVSDLLGTDFTRKSRYTNAVDAAATAKQPGMVALFAIAALQGNNWQTVSPAHFYRLVRALRMTGREPEARMLVAEAVTRA